MYFSFTPQKLTVMATILVVLIGATYSTFAWNSAHFGNLRLPFALQRLIEKNMLHLKYAFMFADESNSNIAAAAGIFGTTQEFRNTATPAEAVPVLLYHALVEEPDGRNMTHDLFLEHMRALKEAGWQTITYDQFAQFIRNKTPIPEKSFLLTFDDGAKDSYYPVDPVLKALNFTAVSFILPKYSANDGSYYYLARGEITSMLESGRWDIQSHGQDSHEFAAVDRDGTEGPVLANRKWLGAQGRLETEREYDQRITNDLRSSKEDIENTFGISVNGFAFPFGEYGQLSKNHPDASNIVRARAADIYDYTFYQTYVGEGFSFNYPVDDNQSLMVKRIGPAPSWSGARVVATLEQGVPKQLPFYDSFEGANPGWFANWSSFVIQDGMLVMQTDPMQTGSGVVLDGSRNWTDYSFTATVDSPKQTGVTLWVRVRDKDNTAACNFGNGFVHAEETLDGERTVIKGARSDEIVIPEDTFTIEARVVGRTLTCYLNGESMVESEFLDHSLLSGGVGIKIWNELSGYSSLNIHEVTIVSTHSTTTTP